MLHWRAWELGVKSLYYCRSKSVQRASFAGVEADNTLTRAGEAPGDRADQLRRVPVLPVRQDTLTLSLPLPFLPNSESVP